MPQGTPSTIKNINKIKNIYKKDYPISFQQAVFWMYPTVLKKETKGFHLINISLSLSILFSYPV
jgi:hypothetical protein